MYLIKLIISTFILSLTNCLQYEETQIENDNSVILSKSRNFTVNSNDTVILPCIIKNLPSTLNTFVIWNQCDDPYCNQLRIPLTVNKDNFVEDLRFRVISDDSIALGQPLEQHFDSLNESPKLTVKRRNNQVDENNSDVAASSSADKSDADNQIANKNVNSWNLEIRKFSKVDEGCYQCQLNTFNVKTIHYCIHLQTKILTDTKKLTVRLNEPIMLKCSSDENVRLSHIKWYRNGHKISEDIDSDIIIEKKPPVDDYLSTSLEIKHASLSDAGIYSCKFGHLSEKIQVDVIINGERSIKSSEIRSNPEEDEQTDTISSSLSKSVSLKSSLILSAFSIATATVVWSWSSHLVSLN